MLHSKLLSVSPLRMESIEHTPILFLLMLLLNVKIKFDKMPFCITSYLCSEAILQGLCQECFGEHWSCYNVTALHLSMVKAFHIKLHGVPRCMPSNIAYYPEATIMVKTLHWCHNEHDGISNHPHIGCLLKLLLRHRSKKISKLREGNPPVTGKAENVSISWHHHEMTMWQLRWNAFQGVFQKYMWTFKSKSSWNFNIV